MAGHALAQGAEVIPFERTLRDLLAYWHQRTSSCR